VFNINKSAYADSLITPNLSSFKALAAFTVEACIASSSVKPASTKVLTAYCKFITPIRIGLEKHQK